MVALAYARFVRPEALELVIGSSAKQRTYLYQSEHDFAECALAQPADPWSPDPVRRQKIHSPKRHCSTADRHRSANSGVGSCRIEPVEIPVRNPPLAWAVADEQAAVAIRALEVAMDLEKQQGGELVIA